MVFLVVIKKKITPIAVLSDTSLEKIRFIRFSWRDISYHVNMKKELPK